MKQKAARKIKRKWPFALLATASLFLLVLNFSPSAALHSTGRSSPRQETPAKISTSPRHTADSSKVIGIKEWQEELETLFGNHEWNRSQILSQKVTVDSEIYLLGVPPPSEQEITIIQAKVDALWQKTPPSRRLQYQKVFSKIIADYDPFGTEGKRVIQIDLPDEPNGRLTGFTCSTDDFATITAQFNNGEMTSLKNLRGFAAPHAGLPLKRFRKLISMDDAE